MEYILIYSIMTTIVFALEMVAVIYVCIINLVSFFALASRKLKTKYTVYMQ